MDDSLIKASIASGISGIISAGFGKGYQPKHISLALENAVRLGIPVVRCARSGCGYTGVGQYQRDCPVINQDSMFYLARVVFKKC